MLPRVEWVCIKSSKNTRTKHTKNIHIHTCIHDIFTNKLSIVCMMKMLCKVDDYGHIQVVRYGTGWTLNMVMIQYFLMNCVILENQLSAYIVLQCLWWNCQSYKTVECVCVCWGSEYYVQIQEFVYICIFMCYGL